MTDDVAHDERPTLAVVGVTGAVGRVVLDVLVTRHQHWGHIRLAAGDEDVGTRFVVGGEQVEVAALTPEFFDGVDVAIFDIPPTVTREWVELAAARGVVAIDNSTVFRGEPDVPLVVPEVNPRKVAERPRGIIANPGGTVMTMIDVLAVLHRVWELRGLVVTTFQAASGLGRAGISRLRSELDLVHGDHELGMRPGDVRRLIEHELGESPFPAPLALNVIPFVGHHASDGWTSEEVKVQAEVRKILDLRDLPVSATCVRVPVVSSHSVTVHATFAQKVKVAEARQVLVEAPAVVLLDDPDEPEFPTPNDVVGADPRFAGRLRQAPGEPYTLDLFISGDNLRKGAARNRLQTAELVAADLAP
ncbi:MAG: aspartate-semialdehyde dehydrogenase [Phycicoccus sp.]